MSQVCLSQVRYNILFAVFFNEILVSAFMPNSTLQNQFIKREFRYYNSTLFLVDVRFPTYTITNNTSSLHGFSKFTKIKLRKIVAKSYDQVLKVPTFLTQDSGLSCFQCIWKDKPKNHMQNCGINFSPS